MLLKPLACCSHSRSPSLSKKPHILLPTTASLRPHGHLQPSATSSHHNQPQPAFLAIGAAIMVGLAQFPSLAETQPPPPDEYTEYKNLIMERTGESLPQAQSYPSAQDPPSSVFTDQKVRLAAEEQQSEQSSKISELQSPQTINKGAAAEDRLAPQQVFQPRDLSSTQSFGVGATEDMAEAGGSVLSLMNVVGVAASGILAGVLVQMKQNKEEIEASLEEELQAERAAVVELREKVDSFTSKVQEEQELVAKLRQETAEKSASAQQKIDFEVKKRAALDEEKRTIEKNLEQERKHVEAARKEANQLRSSLEAEKASKDVLHNELDSIQSSLTKTELALRSQRTLAQKIGETAAQAKAELVDTKRRSTQFMLETANLQDSLVSEQNKRSIAETKVSTLTHELQDAGARLSAASLQVRKANEENANVNESMSALKEECAHLSYSLQLKVNEAVDIRKDADLKLKEYASNLETKSEEVDHLRKSLKDSEKVVSDGQVLISELKEKLEQSKQETKHIQDQMISFEARMENADQLLKKEKESSMTLEQSNSSLMRDLNDLRQGFEDAVEESAAHKDKADALRRETEELKKNYASIGERLQEEQNGLIAVKKQTQILSKQIQDLQKAKKRAEARAVGLEADLAAANQALEVASKERAARERALRKAAESIESERPMLVINQEDDGNSGTKPIKKNSAPQS